VTVDQSERKRIDMLIARILIAKPELTPRTLRRIVPNLDQYDDQALAQKIEPLRRQNAKRRL
jgi:hypothetical protein